MPTRTQRRKAKDSVGETLQSLSTKSCQDNGNCEINEVDYSKLTTSEILKAILERNKDPLVEKMVLALASKIPQEIADEIESDKRARSIVISGISEVSGDVAPSFRQRDLEDKVNAVLDILNVECRPVEVYRLGKEKLPQPHKPPLPRLTKVVLPSKSHWSAALANSYKLRNSTFPNVYVRKSMTPMERQKDYEMRQECRERNNKLKTRTWVVYRGELRRVDDLPKRRSQGNF